MIQRLQTKPIISGVMGQEQLPVVKENRGPSFVCVDVCHWALSRDPRNFKSSFFFSPTVLTWYCVSQDGSLYAWEERGMKWMCLVLTLKLESSVPSHWHTLNKQEIRRMRGSCACVRTRTLGLRGREDSWFAHHFSALSWGLKTLQGHVVTAGEVMFTPQ